MSTFHASERDAELVAQLLRDFNAEFDTPVPELDVLTRRWARLLRRDDVIVVMGGRSEEPSGFAFVTLRPSPYFDGPLAALDELYVRPELRGQGHGSGLIAAVLAELRERACGELQITVDEGDVDARRFYERHGFVNVEPASDERFLCYLQEL